MAALERLQSLTSATAGRPRGRAAAGAPPRTSQSARAAHLASAPAGAPRTGRMVARIAAPAVFLVAVVVLFSLIFQSGVIGGKAEPGVTPTPAVTKTKSDGNPQPSGNKVYVVKSGDTLSGIAVKFTSAPARSRRSTRR